LHDVKSELQDAELANLLTASDLLRSDMRVVTPESNFGDALEGFRHYTGERLPVVNDLEEKRLVGWISKTDLLLAVAERLASPKESA
jgi:CBS domain-containing protein